MSVEVRQTISHYQILEKLVGGIPAIAGQALYRFHPREAETHDW